MAQPVEAENLDIGQTERIPDVAKIWYRGLAHAPAKPFVIGPLSIADHSVSPSTASILFFRFAAFGTPNISDAPGFSDLTTD